MSRATRVLIVVTGDTEEAAFKDALGGLFPSAHFDVRKTQGFTSNRLPRSMPLAPASAKQPFKAKKIKDRRAPLGRRGDPRARRTTL